MPELDESEKQEIKKWFEHATSDNASPAQLMFSGSSYYKSFWQNANHGIVIVNHLYEIVDVNPYFCDLIKATKTELTDLHISDFIEERFIQQDYINIDSIIKGKQYSFKKDSGLKVKSKTHALIAVRIVATRVPSKVDEPFKYVIVHVYPQSNKIVTSGTEQHHWSPETGHNLIPIFKTLIESKWFGWVVTLIVLFTAMSGQLGQFLENILKHIF